MWEVKNETADECAFSLFILEVLHLVFEHPPTSLRGLLLTSRHSSDGRVCSLEEGRLLDLALGVASGMAHLAQRGVHHGQLSTRSVTVVDNLVPKIANFGLARYTPLGKASTCSLTVPYLFLIF